MKQNNLSRPASEYRSVRLLVALAVAAVLPACAMMNMGEAMLGTSEPNEKIYGQLFAVGGATEAEVGADGIARARVSHHLHESIFTPALIMMDEPGTLEVQFDNENPQNHLVVMMASDGNMQGMSLPPQKKGVMRVHYGTPGLYLFMDAMGNHMGRGMMGMVLVEGQVPPEAQLDRPPQPEP